MPRRIIPQCLALLVLAVLIGCTSTRAPTPPPPAPKPAPTPLLVLESGGSPVFTRVTAEIHKRWSGPIRVVRLTGDDVQDAQLLAPLDDSHTPRLVAAIGLEAARRAKQLQGKSVVFCQAFNFEDQQLIEPRMKGVSPLPPAALQFRLWRTADPKLEQIAVVTGPRLSWLLEEVRAAAKKEGLRLVHREVNSDLQAIYAIKNLLNTVDGVWLVPDNRILSSRALREILSVGHKQGKRVLVFNAQLLSLGALLSVEADPADVATLVVERLRNVGPNGEVQGPPIVALTRMSARANSVVAQQLGIALPPGVTSHAHGQ